MSQYINSYQQETQTARLLQQLVGIGNVLVLPLRLISLFLISVVSMILMLLLLFMFTTFLASLIAGRRRTKMRRRIQLSRSISGSFRSLLRSSDVRVMLLSMSFYGRGDASNKGSYAGVGCSDNMSIGRRSTPWHVRTSLDCASVSSPRGLSERPQTRGGRR